MQTRISAQADLFIEKVNHYFHLQEKYRPTWFDIKLDPKYLVQ